MAWNQLAPPLNPDNWIKPGTTLSYNSNTKIMTVTVNGTAAVSGIYFVDTYNMIGNHKYYVSFDIKWSSANFAAGASFWFNSTGLYGVPEANSMSISTNTTNWIHCETTFISNNNVTYGGHGIRLYDCKTQTYPSSFQIKNFNIIDLTQIYIDSSVPTTIETFKNDYFKWFGRPITYEQYDTGSIRNTKIDTLKTIGFNQYDIISDFNSKSLYGYNGNTPTLLGDELTFHPYVNDPQWGPTLFSGSMMANYNYKIKVIPNQKYYLTLTNSKYDKDYYMLLIHLIDLHILVVLINK